MKNTHKFLEFKLNELLGIILLRDFQTTKHTNR